MISIWEKETFYEPQDIIIVGSGFVGLWSAFYLKRKDPDLKITILDRGLIPTGASTRNAGFACFGSLSEIIADAQLIGVDQTLELVEMRYKGLKRIQKYFGNKIDFDLVGGYEVYTENNITAEKLEDNIAYLNALLKPIIKTKKTFRLADETIDEFGFTGVQHIVKNNIEGYLHSGKLVKELLQWVQSQGVQIFNSIEVKGFENIGEYVQLYTNSTDQFKASSVLICTNAFANDLLPDSGIIPARGQVLLTSPIKDLSWKGTFHFDEGFYYFRNLDNRILLGGARNKAFAAEETTDMVTSEFIQRELEDFLSNIILPKYKTEYIIEHRWSGIMGMGREKLPIVKEVQPNVFSALGAGGMGVALAPVIGQQVAKQLV